MSDQILVVGQLGESIVISERLIKNVNGELMPAFDAVASVVTFMNERFIITDKGKRRTKLVDYPIIKPEGIIPLLAEFLPEYMGAEVFLISGSKFLGTVQQTGGGNSD